MADIDVSGDSGHKKGPGVKKAKKLSTRVDMTPMVDLGFLLITFFIFTTTMSTPATMGLIMPKDEKDPKNLTEVKESGSLTIMLGANNNLFYYLGQLKPDGSNFTSSSFGDIRKVIQDRKAEVMRNHIHDATCETIRKRKSESRAQDEKPPYTAAELENVCKDRDFVVVIKPNEDATYKNSVDILDEMAINQVDRFAMIDITENENQLVKATQGAAGTTPAPTNR